MIYLYILYCFNCFIIYAMRSEQEELFRLKLEKNYKKEYFKMDPNTLTYLDILELIRRIRYLEGKLRN